MDRRKRGLHLALLLILVYMVGGTFFYNHVEGWGYVDSFYFTGVTITTVGYGDFAPQTDLAKIVTVFFSFAGVSTFFYSFTLLARIFFEREHKKEVKKEVALVEKSEKKRK